MNKQLREGLSVTNLSLGEQACQQLECYLEELLRWNHKVNLTAITDPVEATEKHLLDSLLLLPYLGEANRVLDMGSGAGLPGIPLQIARPDLEVISVDSVGKKINFQRHVKRQLGLKNFQPVQARLEKLSESLATDLSFDLITARAFSSLREIVQLSSSWLAPGGRVLAMKGPEGEGELEGGKAFLDEAGMRIDAIHKYSLPFSKSERQVIVIV